jgi:GrpB-like predicted nucleotidyltransferase (UPF0157 family)
MARAAEANDWQQRFASERARILAALGDMTTGGIVEQVQHVGATSVPGLVAQPCIDLAAAIWPFPLDDQACRALSALGYEQRTDGDQAPVLRFAHPSGAFHLDVVEAGSPPWMDYLVLRDFLRHDSQACQTLSNRKRGWDGGPEGAGYRRAKARAIEELLDPARRWWVEHVGFEPLQRIAAELRDSAAPWYFCAGWALDLYLGRVRRVHQDVDVLFSRADQLHLYEHLMARGWTLLTSTDERLHPWPRHTRLEPPRHQAHALRDGSYIDLLLADVESGVWRYRRDPRIVRAVEDIGAHSAEGLPYLAPELVLLFKSRNTSGRERGQDSVDFDGVVDHLDPERRLWLRWALTRLEPAHPWLARL